jgi:hypothetical protein
MIWPNTVTKVNPNAATIVVTRPHAITIPQNLPDDGNMSVNSGESTLNIAAKDVAALTVIHCSC